MNPTSVRQIDVPEEARRQSRLPRIDYADAFLVSVTQPGQWPAEWWARFVLSRTPLPARTRLIAGWSAIGLKLVHGGGAILGWEVRRSTPDVALLGAGSRIGMPGELLFERRPEGLLFCTFVAQQTPVARATWRATETVHLTTVRALLDDAARRARVTALDPAA